MNHYRLENKHGGMLLTLQTRNQKLLRIVLLLVGILTILLGGPSALTGAIEALPILGFGLIFTSSASLFGRLSHQPQRLRFDNPAGCLQVEHDGIKAAIPYAHIREFRVCKHQSWTVEMCFHGGSLWVLRTFNTEQDARTWCQRLQRGVSLEQSGETPADLPAFTTTHSPASTTIQWRHRSSTNQLWSIIGFISGFIVILIGISGGWLIWSLLGILGVLLVLILVRFFRNQNKRYTVTIDANQITLEGPGGFTAPRSEIESALNMMDNQSIKPWVYLASQEEGDGLRQLARGKLGPRDISRAFSLTNHRRRLFMENYTLGEQMVLVQLVTDALVRHPPRTEATTEATKRPVRTRQQDPT